jgi:predicted ATPase
VFFTEPWEDIYSTDSERKEPFSTATMLSDFMKDAYIESGYELVTVPKLSIRERAEFVLEKAGLKQ